MFPLETAQTIAIVLLVVGAFLAEYLLSGKSSFQLIKIPIPNLFAKLFTAGFGVFAPLAIGIGFGLAPSEFNFAFWCIGSGAASAVVAVFLWDEIQKLATIWKVAAHTMAITIILCFALGSRWMGS
jgi:hypothetical protein